MSKRKQKRPARTRKQAAESAQDMPLRLEWRTPQELADNPANWRTHPTEQINALTGVLAEVGWAGACLYNSRTNRLIDGHARKKVALEQGTDKIPVLVGNWTEEQEKTILATLDPLASMAQADSEALGKLLAQIETDNEAIRAMLDDLGRENGVAVEAEPVEAPEPQIDRAAELQKRWQTATGQLWVIPSKSVPGKSHRLLCGDSTNEDDVGHVMDGQVADLCFTSPPYGQQRDYGEKAKEQVQDWLAMMCGVFANLPMADDGQVLVNLGLIHRDGEWVPYWNPWIEWMRSQGWRRFGWYVWDQGPGLPGDWNGRLAPSHEFVFHFNRESVRPDKWVEKKEDSITLPHGTGIREKDGSMKGWSSAEAFLQANKIPDSVLRIMRHKARGDECEHPAVFPVELPEFVMRCWPGVSFEPFAGSGSSFCAAERVGTICCGIELDDAYVAIGLQRLSDMGLSPRLAD